MNVIAETIRHTLIVEISREEYTQLLTVANDEWLRDFEKGVRKLDLSSALSGVLRRAAIIAAHPQAEPGYKVIFTYDGKGVGHSNRYMPFETWIRTPEKIKNLTFARQIGRKSVQKIQTAIEIYLQESGSNG